MASTQVLVQGELGIEPGRIAFVACPSAMELVNCILEDQYKGIYDSRFCYNFEASTERGEDGDVPDGNGVYHGGVEITACSGDEERASHVAHIGFHITRFQNVVYVASNKEEMGVVSKQHKDDDRVILVAIGGVLRAVESIWVNDPNGFTNALNLVMVMTSHAPERLKELLKKYGIPYETDEVDTESHVVEKSVIEKPEVVNFTLDYNMLIKRFFGELEIPA